MEVTDWEQVSATLIFEYWFIAIFIHIFGNIISSTRWCIEANHKKTNCGLAIHYVGHTITNLSYGFGPVALLLPLQSLVVVWNALFKSKYTNHDMSKTQVIGMITILVGISMTIIFGPRSTASYYTIEDLLFKFNESSSVFIILLMSLFVLSNWLIYTIQCKYKTDEFYMLTFVHISAYFGAWNIVFTKCILQLISSSLISIQLASLNWTHWLSYIAVIAFILSLIGSEYWKQNALDKYHTEYVLGTHTFLFVIIGIILGSMLFDEFAGMSLVYLIVYFIAIMISFVGVGIVSFKSDDDVEGAMKFEKFNQDWAYQHHATTDIEMIPKDVSYHKEEADSSTKHRLPYGRDAWHDTQELNWQIIGQILMDHEFIETVEATNATLDHLEDFFEEEDILCDDFRDALCASYCNINDEGSILWQVLFDTLNYAKERRLRFYDLVLHEYFTLADMTVSNLVHILCKMTRDLNVSATEFRKIKEILLNNKLDGHRFELMDCTTEFVLLFRSVRSVDESVWCLIYEELMYWAYQEFEASNEIDWESIGCILWQNNFCSDQDELNACLDELEVYFEKEELGPNVLKQELCVCYGNGTDKGSILRNILWSVMHYSKQKRLHFYDILLHKCMDLESLNSLELIAVLRRSVLTVDKTIDWIQFESIAKLHQLNGADLAAIRHSEHFANIFEAHAHQDSRTWERVYQVEMLKWQQYTPTEYEFSVSANTALQRLKTPSFSLKAKPTMKKIQKSLKDRIKSPKNNDNNLYTKIPNEDTEEREEEEEVPLPHEEDDGSEIANALIDILEDVALSQEPYVPSKRAMSQSRSQSKRKEANKMKRRRPSNASQVFPRERRRQRRISKESCSYSGEMDLNHMHLDKYLKFMIEAGQHFKDKGLLPSMIDAYDLTRLSTIDGVNVSQFVETHRYFGEVEEYIIHKNDLHHKCKKTGDFISATLDEYYILFGHKISFAPAIRIMDSMPAFMSYTFSMSNAIKTYMSPSPQISPLIVDLWIIPNKTVSGDDTQHTILNGIGNIPQRLRSNKVRYMKKCCSPSDIIQTTYNILECLCSANIRHGLKHKNANRLVFIIDRRYQSTDYLYCFIPPSKYAKLRQKNVNNGATFHLHHTNHTSRYLLPPTHYNNNNSIGASDNCNGYMFALSFVIYKSKPNRFKTKIYFYSQGGKLRFFPTQMATLWPKYFVKDGNNDDIDINACVEKLFHLNVDDPYLAKHITEIEAVQKQFIIKSVTTKTDKDGKQECIQQLKEWTAYHKTLCQSNIENSGDMGLSKQPLPSTSSTNTTPTTQITPLSNRYPFNMDPEQEKNNGGKQTLAIELTHSRREHNVESVVL